MIQIINKIETFIQSLSKKEFQKYLTVSIGIIAVVLLGATYYIYNLNTQYNKNLGTTLKLARQATSIIAQHKHLQEKEEEIKELLEQNKNFNIIIFFENITNKHGITPEPNWKPETVAIEGSDAFEEVILQTTFPNMTTQKLITFISNIYEEKMVYFKELIITKQETGITCNVTLATKTYKAVLE